METHKDYDLSVEIHKAYLCARKHKRNTLNQLKFEVNLEQNEIKLASLLQNRQYELLPSICFINKTPVKREIIAANFRDRVCHHLLYNWINPIFERQFIFDSYSCRVGKGTLFGIKRAYRYMISESDNFTHECYALRLDISGYFMSINRDILYQLILQGLQKAHWKGVPDKELATYLIHKFVFSDPLKDAVYRSPKKDWDDIPLSKTLRGTPPNCGLPIGNLTSQLFGNIYLNPLDHFVKRELKIRCYGRYVDDIYLIHKNKDVLLQAIPKIRDFLKDKLKLTLHPKKIYLQPITNGFTFLGAFILPYRIYPGRRIVGNFKQAILHPNKNSGKQEAKISSYKGIFSHFDCYKLQKKWSLIV